MRAVFLILFLVISNLSGAQKLIKQGGVDEFTLTLPPTVFDPDQDSNIVYIEFLQDTAQATYPDKIYSCIHKREGFEQVFGIGLIGDFRVKNKVSVIIKTYYANGDIKFSKYAEKINKLILYGDYRWAMYSIDVEIFFEGEEDEVHSL